MNYTPPQIKIKRKFEIRSGIWGIWGGVKDKCKKANYYNKWCFFGLKKREIKKEEIVQ
jgi:hypothetical protein